MISTASETNKRAIRDALGFPVVMLIAGMTGFGSLANQSGLSLGMALTTTLGMWGLPGQVAMAELHAAGVGMVFIILASSLANARFMPMAVSFIPLMRAGVKNYGWMFLLMQLLSINSWAAGQRAFPQIVPALRARYYLVFALICMVAGSIGTAIGFYGIGVMPRAAALGLLFLNPLFFAVLICGSKAPAAIIAIAVGAPLGPILHILSPDWGLLATGLLGGTAAFWIQQKFRPTVTVATADD